MKLNELPDFLADYYAARAQFPEAEVLLMDLGNGAECLVVTDDEGTVPFSPTTGEREAFVLLREGRIGVLPMIDHGDRYWNTVGDQARFAQSSDRLELAITRAYLAERYGAEYDYAEVPVDESQKPLPDDGTVAEVVEFRATVLLRAKERPIEQDADNQAPRWQYTMGPGNHTIDEGVSITAGLARELMRAWLAGRIIQGGRFVPKP